MNGAQVLHEIGVHGELSAAMLAEMQNSARYSRFQSLHHRAEIRYYREHWAGIGTVAQTGEVPTFGQERSHRTNGDLYYGLEDNQTATTRCAAF